VQTARAGAMQHAVALLEKTPILFETLLGDLPAGLLQWKPAPDRWSISEVLSHLADTERVLSERARRLVEENSPVLKVYEQPAGGYAQGSAPEHLACFMAMRRDTLAFLKAIPENAGARTGSHSEIGTITLAETLNEWASHELGHLRQIAELYRARTLFTRTRVRSGATRIPNRKPDLRKRREIVRQRLSVRRHCARPPCRLALRPCVPSRDRKPRLDSPTRALRCRTSARPEPSATLR
jgi:hypothetical protein